MALRAEELKQEAVAAAADLAAERLGSARAGMVQRFLKQFYGHVPPADVLDRRPEDLYGAALSLWQFAQTRRPGRAKLRVINPRIEIDGWRAPATIVEIVNDDMPFLVDSVTAALNGEGAIVHLVIHPVLRLARDRGGWIEALHESDSAEGSRESVMHVEISSVTDETRMEAIAARLEAVLGDVRVAVADWRAMNEACERLRLELKSVPPPVSQEEREESADFLAWLRDDNFTFLGYREYRYGGGANGASPDILPGSGLGVLRDDSTMVFDGLRNFASLVARGARLPHVAAHPQHQQVQSPRDGPPLGAHGHGGGPQIRPRRPAGGRTAFRRPLHLGRLRQEPAHHSGAAAQGQPHLRALALRAVEP